MALLVYPLAIYFFGPQADASFSPDLFILSFGLLCCLRLALMHHWSFTQRALGGLCVALFCGIAWFDTDLRTLKLYPVLMNLGFAAAFIYTLIKPPSAIERISKRFGMTVDGPALSYTTKLTMIWAAFFVINSVIAAYTALRSSTEVWALYNGLISYIAIFILLIAEYPIRLMYKRRHAH